MKNTLIRLRLRQLKRILNEIGIGYFIIVLIFFLAILFYDYLFYSLKDKAVFIFGLTVVSVLAAHIQRKDKEFIYTHVSHPVQNIFSEYLLFSLPFALPALFTNQWYYFPLLVICLLFIANITTSLKVRTLFPKLSNIISTKNFEWLSGIRNNYFGLLLFIVLAVATSPLRIVPLIFLWLIVGAICGFYLECESLQILFSSKSSSKEFIKKKIFEHSKLLLFILVPVLILNSIFNPELILINIAFLLIQLATIIFAILLKYSIYLPNENIKGNSILMAFVSICTFIPFLLPVPLIMCFRNYGKAVKNLNHYLND